MNGNTIPEVFFETAEKYSGKVALLSKINGIYSSITYKKLAEDIRLFSCALKNLGVKKGDKVAILSENRPEWFVVDMATMFLGAVVVPLHVSFCAKAIYQVLEHSESKIVIVSNKALLEKLKAGGRNFSFLEKVILIDGKEAGDGSLTGKIINWHDALQYNVGPWEDADISPEDICSIIYTSGTTGIPKAVMLSHNNILSDVRAVFEAVPIKPSDVFLSFLPLSHVLERVIGHYVPLTSGSSIAYAENIKELAKNIKETSPSILISVPRVFEKFHDAIWDKINHGSVLNKKIFLWALRQKNKTLRHAIADGLVFKKVRKHLGGNLRLAVSGGAALNEKIAKFFLKIGILVVEGYGLTETSPVIAVNREKDFLFGSVGKPIRGVMVRISPEHEILVKGPNVFREYFKNPEETALAFTDGWFRTGDLGFLSIDGFLSIIGRKKEMIVTSGGKNVWPEPIESALNADKYISSSIIIGLDRKFISALIAPDWKEVEDFFKEKNIAIKPRQEFVSSPELLDFFQRRINEKINPTLSDYEKIKKIKIILSEFSQEKGELTPTMKLRRHIIEKDYKKEIDEIYS
jgi:long-chain acyl-CoA synthetase